MVDLEQRILVMSACSTHNCWQNSHSRDKNLNIVVFIVTIILLAIAALVSYFSSQDQNASPVLPEQEKDKRTSSYDRAAVMFLHLFQRRKQKEAVDSTMDVDVWKEPETKELSADLMRQKRQLVDTTFIMDLSNETNILYSGNTLSNNIIAQKSHLEYDFGSVTELEVLAKQFLQLRSSVLPTIAESNSNRNSFSSLSFMMQEDRRKRHQFRREIILFTGPDERRQWLKDDDDDDRPPKKPSTGEDFLWVFKDIDDSDDEEGLAQRVPAN